MTRLHTVPEETKARIWQAAKPPVAAAVFCCNEKTQVQALNRTPPYLLTLERPELTMPIHALFGTTGIGARRQR